MQTINWEEVVMPETRSSFSEIEKREGNYKAIAVRRFFSLIHKQPLSYSKTAERIRWGGSFHCKLCHESLIENADTPTTRINVISSFGLAHREMTRCPGHLHQFWRELRPHLGSGRLILLRRANFNE